MPIVFSAITPHSPILIPQIGKSNQSRLKATLNSFAKLKKILEDKNPDTILVISPHGLVNKEVFTINLEPKFSANFEEFGDFATKKEWLGNVGLAHQIRESLETKEILRLTSNERLDYGVSVPLFLLTEKLPKVRIIPLYYSGLTLAEHFEFGEVLRKKLQKRKQKIAIIASGDLSHRLSKEAPGGYSPKGKKFDHKLVELVQKNKSAEILKMDEKFIEEAGECGLRSILILLGVLSTIKMEPKLLSYEAPFGVGYLTMNFEMQ